MTEPTAIAADAARFLLALRQHDVALAERVLSETPAVARFNIHTAAAVGDAEWVRALLRADPTLVSQSLPHIDLLPLIFAVDASLKERLGVSSPAHLETVRALLDAGADPNTSAVLPDSGDAIPALYFPCVRGDVPLARLLLERGANPTDGEALYHAAQHGHLDCLDLLLESGADLHRGPAEYGNTPLHFLAAHTPNNPIAAAAMRGLHWLLARGADPRIPSTGQHVAEPQRGETPLHRAAAVGHDVAVLRALVEHDAPLNAARDDGRTAYQLAYRHAHADVVTYLASAGADTRVTAIDELLAACASGRADDARRVVEAHAGILDALGPSERDALGLAVTRNDIETVRVMTQLGWPLTQEGEWGGTPLHWAAWHGRPEIVDLLLAAGAAVNVRDTNYGSSPLAWCCHGSQYCDRANDQDYPMIVNRLIDAGATRPESINQWNESPESMARPSVGPKAACSSEASPAAASACPDR
jgi:ankyrin repeat protein